MKFLKYITYLLSWPALFFIAGVITLLYVITYKHRVNID